MTALSQVLAFLDAARAALLDAAVCLGETERADAQLLAQRCDQLEQDVRELRSAVAATPIDHAAVARCADPVLRSPHHGPAIPTPRDGGAYLSTGATT